MNSCGESVAAAETVLACELACILDPMETLAAIRTTVATEKIILRIWYLLFDAVRHSLTSAAN